MKDNVKCFKMKEFIFIFELIAISLNCNLLLITDQSAHQSFTSIESKLYKRLASISS